MNVDRGRNIYRKMFKNPWVHFRQPNKPHQILNPTQPTIFASFETNPTHGPFNSPQPTTNFDEKFRLIYCILLKMFSKRDRTIQNDHNNYTKA